MVQEIATVQRGHCVLIGKPLEVGASISHM